MRDTVLSILLFVTVASASYHHEEHGKDYFAPAHYKFAYGVSDPHTGDKKSQYETRHGDTVKGGYSLHEPDGTIRVVEYTADKHNGFNAVVKKIGHAKHPYHQPKYNTGYHRGGHGHGGATSYVGTTHYGADGHHGYY